MEEENHREHEHGEHRKHEHHEHKHHKHEEHREHNEHKHENHKEPHEPREHHSEHHHTNNEIRIDNDPDKPVKNPWMVAAVLLGVIAVILLFMVLSGKGIVGNVIGVGGGEISGDEAGEKLTEYLNVRAGGGVEYVSYEDMGNLYEIIVSYQGQDIPVYITKDGEYFVQGAVPMTGQVIQQQQPQETIKEYSEEDLVKIKEFSQCLSDNGVKAYGAGWCGYCKKLKDAFGGEEQIAPFYIECQNVDRTPTEQAELCEEEQITGFPTIKINGEPYGGARTIEGLANAVEECDAPVLSV